MTIKCIIIDDEYPARVLLTNYVDKLPQLELLRTFKNPVEAMTFLQEQEIDLIFLDIQMPELTGVQFLRSVRQRPSVIFTTAYADYALEGYQLDVIDYLLKPFTFERFVQAVSKATEWITFKKEGIVPSTSATQTTSTRDYLTVKADHKILRIRYNDILYIEGLREYVTFFTNGGKIITLESLKNLEEALPQEVFLRVHKSYIVNREKVKSLSGNQLEIEGKYIPIGKSYKDEVVDKIFK